MANNHQTTGQSISLAQKPYNGDQIGIIYGYTTPDKEFIETKNDKNYKYKNKALCVDNNSSQRYLINKDHPPSPISHFKPHFVELQVVFGLVLLVRFVISQLIEQRDNYHDQFVSV